MENAYAPLILLVEDEPDILAILHRLMEGLAPNYTIVSIADAPTALDYVETHPIPLVITDYNMPEMNGLTLAARLKQRAPEAQVAMITAYDTPQLRERALASGIDYYLPKPFPFERLEQIVRQALA